MIDIKLFIREHYIEVLTLLLLYLLLLAYRIFHKAINKMLTTLWASFSTMLKKLWRNTKVFVVSTKYKTCATFEKYGNKVKHFFKKRKGHIFFLLFYVLYIAFFIFLVIYERMQEADVAFKYIIFPLYFAVPILFKNVFEKM